MKLCLDTGWVSSVGSFVNRFEEKAADYIGRRYAVATVNGTSALHVALQVAGIRTGMEVLVPTLTFIAPANAVRYCGAWPVFIEAEKDYWQMDTQKCIDFLEKECRWMDGELRNRVTGRQVKAILPVHILGHPVDFDPLLEIARKYDLTVIEDATESLGAKYKNRAVGCLGDIACFSFNGNKLITTGGGGMIVTDNEEWALKARYLTTQAKDHEVESVHDEIGYNYRLSNVSAAIGMAQFELIDDYIGKKRQIASVYSRAFAGLPGITPMREADWAFSVFWLYTVLVEPAEYGLSSRTLLSKLAERGIQTRPLWQPIHLSRAHKDCQSYNCPTAGILNRQALSLPCSVGLSESDQQRVAESLFHFANK